MASWCNQNKFPALSVWSTRPSACAGLALFSSWSCAVLPLALQIPGAQAFCHILELMLWIDLPWAFELPSTFRTPHKRLHTRGAFADFSVFYSFSQNLATFPSWHISQLITNIFVIIHLRSTSPTKILSPDTTHFFCLQCMPRGKGGRKQGRTFHCFLQLSSTQLLVSKNSSRS